MHHTMTMKSLALAGIGAVALLLLVTVAFPGPAQAAPRAGITIARGRPAEAVAGAPHAGTAPRLSFASIAAAPSHVDKYAVIPWSVAWAIGAVGAVLLLGGSWQYALAQRRGRGGRLSDLTGRTPSDAREDRRRAA